MNLTKKQSDILFLMLIIMVLGFILFAVYYMVSNKEAFTENPFTYGAEKMDLGDCNCVCYNNGFAQPKSLYFNSTSFSGG